MLGRWYLAYSLSYRAVEKEGNTVDFMLSEKRDEPAARAFFEKIINSSGIPDKITMGKSGANKAGIDTFNLHLALLFMLGVSLPKSPFARSNILIIVSSTVIGL